MEKQLMFTATNIANAHSLKNITVGIVFASFHSIGRGKGRNLGLKLKSSSREVSNPDYASKIDGKWFYTKPAFDLFNDYFERYSKIIKAVDKNQDVNLEKVISRGEIESCYRFAAKFREENYKRIDIHTSLSVNR